MDDLISRQAAIEAVTQYCPKYDLRELLADIECLPTAEKKGEWIISSDGYYPYCSKCHFRPHEMTNYCPNCGADMRGEQDDESRSNSNAQTDTRARGMGATDKSSGI